MTEISTLRCPSDPGFGSPSSGRTNYAVCLGDAVQSTNEGVANSLGLTNTMLTQRAREGCRGLFVPRQFTRFRDVLDGLANTVSMGEIMTDLGERDSRCGGGR